MRPTGLLVATLCLALASCAPPPRESVPESSSEAEARATAALAAGRYREAARAYEALAEAQPERRDPLLLTAARAAAEAGDRAGAERLLARLDERRLDARDRAGARLLRATLGRETTPPHRQLALLDGIVDQLEGVERARYHELRAEALAASGQPYASARERIRLGRLLPESESAAANRLALARALQRLTAEQARRLATFLDPASEMSGWLDLVASVKEAVFAGDDAPEAVAAWRLRHPSHPAGRTIADQLLADYDRGFLAPSTVAVLLPETGPLAAAGRSVRDGLAAAYLTQGGLGQLVFYDSGPTPAAAVAGFRAALEAGARAVIGPLDREAVAAVLLEADGTVPVLALNYVPGGVSGGAPTAPGTFQFGLLPEHEAAAAAEQMLRDGYSRAAVLSPDGAWGARVREAFIERFTALGGVLQDLSAYPERGNDFGPVIERLVGLQAARVRHRALQSDLGLPLAFEAKRRPDLDALFLVARPREGRLIKPQLAFNSSGDLPVYATSHVYGGSAGEARNQDLEGVRFCDAPWLLESQGFQFDLAAARAAFPTAAGGSGRLFALGYDAYRLLPYLDWLRRFPDDRFPGATGQLRIAAGGIVDRTPDCAEFRRGQPRFLEPQGEGALAEQGTAP